MWAKLLQARAGARGPRLLVGTAYYVLWWTVRERAEQSNKKKWVKGNPAWLREQPATASRVERAERNWTQQVDSQGSA